MLKRFSNSPLSLALLFAGCLLCANPTLADDSVSGKMLRAAQHLRMGEGEQALALWKPLAEQGQVDAQFNLGTIYLYGDGVSKNDEQAIKWFRLAAEQGDRSAQQQLGAMILNGQGIAANPEEGYRWINKRQLDHLQHAQHLEQERQRAAKLLWQEEMQESYLKNRGDQGKQVIAALKRRAGITPIGTELAAR